MKMTANKAANEGSAGEGSSHQHNGNFVLHILELVRQSPASYFKY